MVNVNIQGIYLKSTEILYKYISFLYEIISKCFFKCIKNRIKSIKITLGFQMYNFLVISPSKSVPTRIHKSKIRIQNIMDRLTKHKSSNVLQEGAKMADFILDDSYFIIQVPCKSFLQAIRPKKFLPLNPTVSCIFLLNEQNSFKK